MGGFGMDFFPGVSELEKDGEMRSEGEDSSFHEDIDELIKANTIGLWQHQKGRFDRSLEQFWNSLILSRKLGYIEWESVALTNIGMVYQSWGKYDHALKFYHESLKVSSLAGFLQGQSITHNQIGTIHESRGQLEKAIEKYRTAMEIAERIRDLPRKRLSLLNMIRCYEKLGDFMTCACLFDEVIRIDQVMGHPCQEADRAYFERLMARL